MQIRKPVIQERVISQPEASPDIPNQPQNFMK